MNSRKNALDALNHRSPGRVPVDFGSTAVTGMHVSIVSALREYYGLEKRPVKVHDPYQMLGLMDDDLKEVMGVDFTGVYSKKNLFGFENENWKEFEFNSLTVLVPGKFNTTRDELGNTYLYPEGDTSLSPSGKLPAGGYYFDAIIRQEPIDEDRLRAEDNLEEFQELTEDEVLHFKRELERTRGKDKAVVISVGGLALGDIALVPGTFLRHPKGIRDVEEWYISTAMRQDLIHEIFEKQTETGLKNLEKINGAAGDLIDVIFTCGTDFGTQMGTFCSRETFKELYGPYYRKINQWIKGNTSWKTFKHSCGAIESFIPLFIDLGFDIINPVQCSARGMDPVLLKEKYGDKIVFWGGGVDTQKTLPFGTREEVRREVLERLEVFSPGGGFVFNGIHNIQANTPVENIGAMIDAVNEFNGKG